MPISSHGSVIVDTSRERDVASGRDASRASEKASPFRSDKRITAGIWVRD
jgi:hypothetical protein